MNVKQLLAIVIISLVITIGTVSAADIFKEKNAEIKDMVNVGSEPPQFSGLTNAQKTNLIFKNLVSTQGDLMFGEAVFEMYNPFTKDVPLYIDYKLDRGDIKSEIVYIQQWDNYTRQIVQTQEIKNYICIDGKGNGTPYTCYNKTVINNTINQSIGNKIWVKTNNSYIPASYSGQVKVISYWDTPAFGKGGKAIEWIPKLKVKHGIFDFEGVEYKQIKWAWWNANWEKKKHFNVTCQDHANCVLEPLIIPIWQDVQINSSNGYPEAIRVVDETDTIEIPYMWVNNTTTNSRSVLILANSTNTTTKFNIYYENSGAAAVNYSVGWSPYWADPQNASFFFLWDTFEDNETSDWVANDACIEGTSSTNHTKTGNYAMFVNSTAPCDIKAISKNMVKNGGNLTWTGDMVVNYDIYPIDAGNNYLNNLIIQPQGGALSKGMKVRYDVNGDSFLYNDGAWKNITTGRAGDSWYNTNFTDSINIANYAPWNWTTEGIHSNNTLGLAAVTNSYFEMCISDPSNARIIELYIDNIFISPFEANTYNTTSLVTALGAEETAAEVIFLVSPPSGNSTQDTTPDHTFYYDSATNTTAPCTLYYNASSKGSNGAVANNTNTTITASATSDGTYLWWVNCTLAGADIKSEEWNITINSTSWVFINSKDEETTSYLEFNLSLDNGTSTITVLNITEYFQTSDNTSTGTVQATCSKDTYTPRSFFYNFNVPATINRTCYMLKTSSGNLVRFHVQTPAQIPLQNALVRASRTINGTVVIIDEDYTDGTGTATLFLSPLFTYTIFAQFGGQSTTELIKPTGSDYTIILGTGGGLSFQNVYLGVSFGWIPLDDQLYLQQGNASILWRVTNSNLDLEYWGLNITYNGSKVFTHTDTVNNSGGLINGTFNITGAEFGDEVFAHGFFKRAEFDMVQFNKTYVIRNESIGDTSLVSLFNTLKQTSGLTTTGKTLTAIIVSSLLTVVIVGTFGIGAGFVGIGLLAMFAVLGWFPANLLFLVISTLIAAYVIRGRI